MIQLTDDQRLNIAKSLYESKYQIKTSKTISRMFLNGCDDAVIYTLDANGKENEVPFLCKFNYEGFNCVWQVTIDIKGIAIEWFDCLKFLDYQSIKTITVNTFKTVLDTQYTFEKSVKGRSHSLMFIYAHEVETGDRVRIECSIDKGVIRYYAPLRLNRQLNPMKILSNNKPKKTMGEIKPKEPIVSTYTVIAERNNYKVKIDVNAADKGEARNKFWQIYKGMVSKTALTFTTIKSVVVANEPAPVKEKYEAQPVEVVTEERGTDYSSFDIFQEYCFSKVPKLAKYVHYFEETEEGYYLTTTRPVRDGLESFFTYASEKDRHKGITGRWFVCRLGKADIFNVRITEGFFGARPNDYSSLRGYDDFRENGFSEFGSYIMSLRYVDGFTIVLSATQDAVILKNPTTVTACRITDAGVITYLTRKEFMQIERNNY